MDKKGRATAGKLRTRLADLKDELESLIDDED